MKYLEDIKNNYITSYLDNLTKLVAIPSVAKSSVGEYPFGKSCDDALEFMLGLANEFGADLIYKDPTNYYGFAEFGTGEKCLDAMCHLDVVTPGDSTRWKSDPFIAIIENDYMYGRGILDTKGPVMAALYSARYLKSNNMIQEGYKIRLVFGLNEEEYFKSILKYKKDFGQPELPSLTIEPGSGLYLKQKGKIDLNIIEDITSYDDFILDGPGEFNVVCDTLKIKFRNKILFNRVIEYLESNDDIDHEYFINEKTLIIHGNPSHGSLPELGINAVLEFSRILKAVEYKNSKVFNWINDWMKHDYNLTHIFGDKQDETGKLSCSIGFIKSMDNELIMGIEFRIPPVFDFKITQDTIIDSLTNISLQADVFFSVKGVDHTGNRLLDLIQKSVNDYSAYGYLDYQYTGAVSYSCVFEDNFTVSVTQDFTKIMDEIKSSGGDYIYHAYNERLHILKTEYLIAFYVDLFDKFLQYK